MDQQIHKINEYISIFNLATQKYDSQKKMIGSDSFHQIEQFSKNFEKDARSIIENNRKLKIGVVGQIKAGKSSFLNALLFNGKDMLPKAATPMTAALTVISYSEKPKAEIEFYSVDEWQTILINAQKYEKLIHEKRQELSQGINKFKNHLKQVAVKAHPVETKLKSDKEIKDLVQAPDDIKTAYELVTMANKSSFSIQPFLGTTKTIEHIDNSDQLIGELQQYVGAEGSYTPIVKSTKVFIPNEALQSVEVIDTPGINDPIISRGQKTREYLGQCDVIFLLSYSGQFMDSVDIELLTQSIPDKGIVNVVLLGSKFDSVLLDAGTVGINLSYTLADVNRKLTEQATNTITPVLSRFPDNSVLQSLKESLPPIFISSMAYNIANEFGNLNKEQKHILNRLEATFPADKLSAELLKDISNIDRIKKVELEKVLSNKEVILRGRFDNLLESQRSAFIKELSKMKDELEKDLHRILNSSGEDLEAHFKKIEKGIGQARKKVELVFSRYITDMQKGFRSMKSDFKESAARFRKFDESTESKREVVGTERYGFLWLNKRNVYETRTYSYANVHQTIDNIENLVLDLDKKLKSDFDLIIQVDRLKHDLKTAIKGIFDLSDESFDFEDVIIPVEKTVNKISIPKFELNGDKYRETIINKFGLGRVEGSEVNKLREMQYFQIDEILKDIEKNIDQTFLDVQAIFNKLNIEFINDVLKESQVKKNILLEDIKNLKDNEIKYRKLILELEHDIGELKVNGSTVFRLVKEWENASSQTSSSPQLSGSQAIEMPLDTKKEAISTLTADGVGVHSSTVNLKTVVMGQKVALPSDSANLVFHFSANNYSNIDIDLSAFIVGGTGKVTSDQGVIFYNQPSHPTDSVSYSLENGEQSIQISLDQVPVEASKIVLTLSTYGSQSFNGIKDLQVHMSTDGIENIRYPIRSQFYNESSIVLCEIYRYKNEWKYGAIGQGHHNGLEGLCHLFGVSTD